MTMLTHAVLFVVVAGAVTLAIAVNTAVLVDAVLRRIRRGFNR
jgi:hypothetical protein